MAPDGSEQVLPVLLVEDLHLLQRQLRGEGRLDEEGQEELGEDGLRLLQAARQLEDLVDGPCCLQKAPRLCPGPILPQRRLWPSLSAKFPAHLERRGQGGTEEGGDPQAGPVGAPECPRVRIRLGEVRGGERGPCPSEMGKRGTHGQGQDARVVLAGGGCLAPRLVHEDAEQLPQHPLCGWGLRHHRLPHGDGDAAGPPGCQQGLPRPGCCPRWWCWGGRG